MRWQLYLCPDPTGKLEVLPKPLAGFRGRKWKERGERMKMKNGRGGKGRGGEEAEPIKF